MRPWKVLVALVLCGFLLVAMFFFFIFTGARPNAQAAPTTCVATLTGGVAAGPQAGTLDDEQRGIAGAIIGIGKQRGLSPRAWQIAIQAGKTESNLRNVNHGDRDSLGVFQMRPSMGWGSVAEVTNVTYAVNKFYDVLLAVSGWESLRPGEAAQRVERSAFPDRYHQHEGLAVALINEMAGVSLNELTGCAPSPGAVPGENQWAAKAIEYANAQMGKPYEWGAQGPLTFDCSGLVMAAYRHAGLAVPKYSGDQFLAGKHVPVAEAQPGDLIFWADSNGNPEAIYHVAIYIGNNQVIQAPQDGDSVKISTIWQKELVPMATRPGVQ